MNKQEAIKKTEELEKQLAELKAIIEAPDTSELVFKPKWGERYDYIGNKGYTVTVWVNDESDLARLKVGNVFRIGEAKNSAKYYIMNSDYDYWFPWSGQPKPKVLPKGLEYWSFTKRGWNTEQVCTRWWESSIYRWKRELQ